MKLLPQFVHRRQDDDISHLLNKIHHADCMDLLARLPDNSVDMVVTSPPYNLNSHGGKTGMFKDSNIQVFAHNGYNSYSDEMEESSYQQWIYSVINECLRVSIGLVWVNHKTRYRDGIGIHPLSFLKFPLYSEVVWNRRFSIALNSGRYSPSHEFFFGFGKPHFWDNSYNTFFTVWDDTIKNRPEHPCPYPVSIVEKLIAGFCPPHGIVIDPFAGSGTTAYAAINMNQKYIGAEMDSSYVELARTRLQNSDPYQATVNKDGSKQLSLFEGIAS